MPADIPLSLLKRNTKYQPLNDAPSQPDAMPANSSRSSRPTAAVSSPINKNRRRAGGYKDEPDDEVALLGGHDGGHDQGVEDAGGSPAQLPNGGLAITTSESRVRTP